jgi:hypothetical protein
MFIETGQKGAIFVQHNFQNTPGKSVKISAV